MDACVSHDPWDLPVRDIRALLGVRTPKLVVERYEESCVVTGFYTLDADELLKFCRKWRLHVLVQFEPSPNHTWKSFRIVLSADPFTLELDPDATEPKIDYSSYNAQERAIIQPLIGQFSEVGAREVRVVLFPRVIHTQFWPQLGITGETLQHLTQFSGVTKTRIGGDKQCVEVVVRRPAKRQRSENKVTKASKRAHGRHVSTAVQPKSCTQVLLI